MAEEVLDGINAAFEEVVAKEWRKVWQVAGLERRALRVAS
jgi:predicted component of type VI protein secretion system